jgi:hypothetical protein
MLRSLPIGRRIDQTSQSYVDFWCMKGKEGRAYPAG